MEARLALAPATGRASPAQSPLGSSLSQDAPSAPRLSPPRLGVPRSCARSGSRLETREEGGSQGAASSDPETPYKEQEGSPAGTNLIWAAPYLERPDLAQPLPAREEGRRRREGAGATSGTPGPLVPGRPSCGLSLRLSQGLGAQGAGAGSRASGAGWWCPPLSDRGLHVTPGPPGQSCHIRASCFPYMAMYVTTEAGPCCSRPFK